MADRLAFSAQVEVTSVTNANLVGAIRPSHDPDTVYLLKPGRRWMFEGAPARTNSEGFRGAEFTPDKPPGVTRVVGLGDSVMFGWGVADDDTFMARLQTELRDARGALELINCAVPGYNAEQEAALAETRVARYAPDVLLLNYVLNDHERSLFATPDPLEEFLLRSFLFERARTALERPWLGPRRVSAAFERLARASERGRFRVVVCVYPQRLSGVDAELPRRLALRHGFTYVDLYAPFDAYYAEHGLPGLEALMLSASDQHPNARGHALMAAVLAPALRRVLAEGPARPR